MRRPQSLGGGAMAGGWAVFRDKTMFAEQMDCLDLCFGGTGGGRGSTPRSGGRGGRSGSRNAGSGPGEEGARLSGAAGHPVYRTRPLAALRGPSHARPISAQELLAKGVVRPVSHCAIVVDGCHLQLSTPALGRLVQLFSHFPLPRQVLLFSKVLPLTLRELSNQVQANPVVVTWALRRDPGPCSPTPPAASRPGPNPHCPAPHPHPTAGKTQVGTKLMLRSLEAVAPAKYFLQFLRMLRQNVCTGAHPVTIQSPSGHNSNPPPGNNNKGPHIWHEVAPPPYPGGAGGGVRGGRGTGAGLRGGLRFGYAGGAGTGWVAAWPGSRSGSFRTLIPLIPGHQLWACVVASPSAGFGFAAWAHPIRLPPTPNSGHP